MAANPRIEALESPFTPESQSDPEVAPAAELAQETAPAIPSTNDAATASAPQDDSGAGSDPESRQQAIAQAAYFRAEARGFEPGHELEDWLAAEQQIGLR